MQKVENTRNIKSFIGFLVHHRLYTHYISELAKYHNEDLDLEDIINNDISNAFNYSFLWSSTTLGHSFWSTISYFWKKELEKRNILPYYAINYFEIHSKIYRSWKEINKILRAKKP